MSDLARANMTGAPDHAVLEASHSYDVVAFSYAVSEAPYGTLDLVLKKAGSMLTLRFDGVHELEVDSGFPHSSMGLEIRDISHFGWENARVRVQGVEEDPAPAIRFWAREVSRVAA